MRVKIPNVAALLARPFFSPAWTQVHLSCSRARVASSRRVEAMLSGEELARAVLKAKDRYELLSLGSAVPVVLTADGFLNLEDEEVRKCYTKIAARIHPDKLPGCSDATKAFQALVRAYELCCKPELRADDSDDSRDDDDDDDDDDDEDEDDEDDEDEDLDEVVAQVVAQAQAPPARGKAGAKAPKGAEASAPKPKAATAKKAKKKKPDSSSDDDDDDDDGDDEDDDNDDSDSSDEKPLSRKPSPKKPTPTAATAAKPPPKKASAKPSAKPSAKASAKRCKGAKRSGGAAAASYRTGVRCPRCHSEWGAHLKGEGREPLYTQFMRGQTQVHCLALTLTLTLSLTPT